MLANPSEMPSCVFKNLTEINVGLFCTSLLFQYSKKIIPPEVNHTICN